MEKCAELAAKSQFACIILGNAQTWDVLLLRLPYRWDDLADEMVRRGLNFLGVAALVDGAPRTALVQELCQELMTIASLSFLAELERALLRDEHTQTATPEPVTVDDGLQFLDALYALPDPRG